MTMQRWCASSVLTPPPSHPTPPPTRHSHFHKLPGGLADGVSLQLGMACEFFLGALLNLVVLFSMCECLGGRGGRAGGGGGGSRQQAACSKRVGSTHKSRVLTHRHPLHRNRPPIAHRPSHHQQAGELGAAHRGHHRTGELGPPRLANRSQSLGRLLKPAPSLLAAPVPPRPPHLIPQLPSLPLPPSTRQITAGSGFSGPGLNPAMTFSFFVHYSDAAGALQHALLYWAAPIAGALAGGLAWRAVNGPGVGKRAAVRRGRQE
jgi:hypothetical protein